MKNTKQNNNVDKIKFLDKEEEEIIKSFEKDEWISDLTKDSKTEIEEAASFSMKKNKRINLRLTDKDYHDIKIKAVQKGIPYQSLISSLIHQYNKGGISLEL